VRQDGIQVLPILDKFVKGEMDGIVMQVLKKENTILRMVVLCVVTRSK